MTDRRARTRDRLLDGATAEFLDRGYAGATLASVAARAGVSTATLHKYFPTKRELFGGVMERFFNAEADDVAPPADLAREPRRALLGFGEAYARIMLPETTPALFRVVIAEAIQHPEMGEELYARGKQPYLARLERFVEEAVAAGTLAVPDVPLAVRQFLGMINDVLFWPRLLVAGLEVTEAMVTAVVEGAVDTFLARYGVR